MPLKMRGKIVLALFAVLPLLGPVLAHASGTYEERSLRLLSPTDNSKYELGKNVFAGEVVSDKVAERVESQTDVLRALQDKLPRELRSEVSLTDLAGRLNDEQIEALRYFLKVRYRIQ